MLYCAPRNLQKKIAQNQSVHFKIRYISPWAEFVLSHTETVKSQPGFHYMHPKSHKLHNPDTLRLLTKAKPFSLTAPITMRGRNNTPEKARSPHTHHSQLFKNIFSHWVVRVSQLVIFQRAPQILSLFHAVTRTCVFRKKNPIPSLTMVSSACAPVPISSLLSATANFPPR